MTIGILMKKLKHISIPNFTTASGYTSNLLLSYQTFGKPLHSAPIVMVNHALTGNSSVSGNGGWWKTLIGDLKCIDTNHFTILAFDMPGNGYNGDDYLINQAYKFSAQDVAKLLLLGLKQLQINSLFALIGGSVGGGIAWEMIAQNPAISKHLIPVATDWKATDWVIANCHIQDGILNNSSQPLQDARMHAMTLYRTPESFTYKFNRTKREKNLFNTQSWLNHHGNTLTKRFKLTAYIFMNHIMRTVDITRNTEFKNAISGFKGEVHLVSINTDLLYKPQEIKNTHEALKTIGVNSTYHEIKSIHGHDAFLIEYQQLQTMLTPIFKS